MDQRSEAQERPIREQQKAIDELKTMLLKVVESTQKIVEDKAKTSSPEPPPKTNEDKDKENEEEKTYSEYREDSKFFFIDPHVEKMEKL